MSQRDVLENAINLANTLRGPAKLLYGPGTLPFPVGLDQVISASTGAAATGWTALGLTRGGINVQKTITQVIRDDVDQILGAYDQDITDRAYTISSQLAEVLDRTQMGIVWDMGTPTVVPSGPGGIGAATQVMVPLDDGDNKTTERRFAVIWPKTTNGKVYGLIFRRAALAGGDKVFRFDKNDPASPPLEMRAFPEISTTIDPALAWGVMMEHI